MRFGHWVRMNTDGRFKEDLAIGEARLVYDAREKVKARLCM